MNRQTALAKQLEEVSSRIRALVASIATQEAAHLAFGVFQLGPSEAMEQLGLSSPVAQMRHFLGHVLLTPAPDEESGISGEQRMQLFELLGRASDLYPFLFIPRPDEFESLDQEERLRYATAGPAFISHFFQGSLSTTDQVLNRLEAYFTPFDDQLRDELRLSASQGLEITKWLGQQLSLRLDQTKRNVRLMYDVYKSAMEQGWTAERSRAEAKEKGIEGVDPLIVKRNWISQEFGSTLADAYWELLVGARGSTGGPDFTFFTEATPYDRYPLLGMTASLAYCPSYHSICLSLFAAFEGVICGDPSVHARFLRHRDDLLEKQTAGLFRNYFGAEAEVYESICETSKGQFEHDVVVRYRDVVLVVEAKASPLVEPFRDAAKSFERLKHRFSGERGIQKAYDQAMRVVRRLNDDQDIQLFDHYGQPVLALSGSEIDSAIPVCVTADSWGIFATDVSLLLEKQADDPWPWAVWIFDLEVFLEALELQEQDPDAFLSFLQQRVDLQGRLGTSDELEICGMYVKHGRLPRVSTGALLQPIPEYAEVFDQIYFWKQGLRDKPDLSINPEMFHANTTQLARKGAMAMARAAVALDGVPNSVGRNDPCPCGSGRKFKRCHGSPTGHQ